MKVVVGHACGGQRRIKSFVGNKTVKEVNLEAKTFEKTKKKVKKKGKVA